MTSDHGSRSERTQRRYFSSQVFDADSELSEAKLDDLSSYVVAHWAVGASRPTVVEVVEGGAPVSVSYLGPNGLTLVGSHVSTYGPIEYTTVDFGEHSETQRIHDGHGALLATIVSQLDDRGDVQRETTLGPDGATQWTVEYDYDEEGELEVVREYGPDGGLASEEWC